MLTPMPAVGTTNPASRRAVLRALGAGALGLLAPQPGLAAQGRKTPRPNIIFIVTDDMRADDLVAMPAVQSLLVAQGTHFTNFIVTSPTCAPARASILRGQYPQTHGVLRGKGEEGGFGQFHERGNEASTLPVWLQEAGYRTALIGKYLNGYPNEGLPYGLAETYVPPGWDEWAGLARDGYFRFSVVEEGVTERFGAKGEAAGYSTDLIAEKATAFIATASTAGDPFFLYLAPRAPHGPAEPATRHANALAGTTAPRPPSFGEEDLSDKPGWMQTLPLLNEERGAEIDAYHLARLRTLLAVDEMVTQVVAALEAAGLLEQTFIVFTSDNGYHLGEHRIVQKKGFPYEESIRVPLVVRGPGVPGGQTVDALASQIDLAPTFAEWAGARVPDSVEGRSLAGLLAEGVTPLPWRQFVLVQHAAPSGGSSDEHADFAALRMERFVYVEHASGERELYDLIADPYQLANLAAETEPDALERLSALLAAMVICAGAECRAVEETSLPCLADCLGTPEPQ